MSQPGEDQTALLQAILDTTVAAITVLDPQGRIVYANRRAEEILGLTSSEIVKRAYNAPEWKSTAPDGGPWPDEHQPFSLVMRTGEPVHDVQHAIEWPNGKRKQLSVSGAPIKNGRGEITSLVFSITDISERFEIEQQLRENSAWLRLALEAAQMGTWSWTVAENRLRVSDEAARLFGLRVEEFGGSIEAYLALVHPDDVTHVRNVIEETLKSRTENSMEHRAVRANGEIIWVECRGRVVRDTAGMPMTVTGSVMDITTRKTAELALGQSEEMFRSVLETVPSYIVSVARDRTIRFVNRTLPHLRVADVIGKDVVGFLAEESRPAYKEALDRAFATGELQELEGLSLQPDGDPAPFLIRIGPVVEDGKVECVTSVGVDVSEIKETERALRESRELLRRAQRLESVGRLAGGMAHDFNNLLTAILGCADLTHARLADRPKERALVDQIRSAADRGSGLTQKLLAFASQRAVQPRVVDVNRLILQAHQLLRRLIGEDIELATDLASDAWPVEVDPGQFEQVLINLAINGRDAMPDGGRLTITSSNLVLDDGERGWVAVTVSDTGIGMDEDTLRQSFDPFFTTKEPGKGTGLGLSTCFGIIRQAGGHIDAESEPARGTRFRILLPRSFAPAEADAPTASREISSGRETVLVVEDDTVVRDVTRAMLERAGYHVLEASNGDEALALFEDRGDSVELLLTDVVMPQMNGAELATQLLARKPELKVLFVSGYSPDLDSLERLIGKGIHLVQKPFTASVLSHKVREVLDG